MPIPKNSVHILVDLLDGGRVDLTLNIETHLSNPDEDPWVPSIQVHTAMADTDGTGVDGRRNQH